MLTSEQRDSMHGALVEAKVRHGDLVEGKIGFGVSAPGPQRTHAYYCSAVVEQSEVKRVGWFWSRLFPIKGEVCIENASEVAERLVGKQGFVAAKATKIHTNGHVSIVLDVDSMVFEPHSDIQIVRSARGKPHVRELLKQLA